jgi:DNA-binding CsgD family transcriptional regulator
MEKRSTFSRPSETKKHLSWENIFPGAGNKYEEIARSLARNIPTLTPVELFVAVLRRATFRNWEIAQKLFITEKTVENHCNNIRRKLGLGREQNLTIYLFAIQVS